MATADNNFNETGIAILAHFLGVVTIFIGPTIIWTLHRDNRFIGKTCREVLNFQLTMLIPFIALFILARASVPVWLLFLVFLLAAVASIARIVYGILGAMKANQGQIYSYPFSVPFIPNI